MIRAHGIDLRNPQTQAQGPLMPLRLCTMAIYASHPKQPPRPPGILLIFLLFLEKIQNEALPVVIPQPNFNHILTDDRESQRTWFHTDIPSTTQENESEVHLFAQIRSSAVSPNLMTFEILLKPAPFSL